MRRGAHAALAALGGLLVAGVARADSVLPPWADPHDLPLPDWAKSVAPARDGIVVASAPGRPDQRRGTVDASARLPLYASARGAQCAGRWFEVGPMAWVCSDTAEPSRDEAKTSRAAPDESPAWRHFYVGRDGAQAFVNSPTADSVAAPDETLDPGFAVAVAEERTLLGRRWGRTLHGRWIAMSELAPYQASRFHGEEIKEGAGLDLAWVVSDLAGVFATPSAIGKPAAKLPRFERVAWREERPAPHGGGAMVRVSDDGVTPERWMRVRDLAHAALQVPPDVIGGATATERWVDIDAAQQTLVAYEGTRPVFATLVSTGRGAPGDPAATPEGVHRIGAKLVTNDMDNLALESEDDAGGEPFAVEDVPYVQSVDRGVALFGAFWHGDFGRPRGRGNVALAPRDAAWLFAFTAPHLPAGWSSAYPTPLEPGTVVRVRAGDAVARDFPLDQPRETSIHKSPGETP